ncbi:MAG: penicillin-binding protein [Candidatus Dojkabacteria bacterium]|nr:MAG: penicillin-binding protein [Candidatus Dojkabacteria bacterium]
MKISTKMGYSTKIKLSAGKDNKRFKTRSSRNFSSRKWSRSSGNKAGKKGIRARIAAKLKQEKVRKFLYSFGAVMLIIITVGLIFGLAYVQSITEDLPSRDKPFGNKSAASVIYDRNGKELYRVFGDENRDPVALSEVPQLLQWAFLAAEDIDFYSHPGVDLTAIIRCGFVFLREGESACGGSTITQQLIKQTALTNERKLERKIKEVILALQIERERSKEEILEMYLTVAPEGSNIYGVTSAAKVYFGKDLKDLNLAEMSILAAIPQDPTRLSPTKSANPERAQELVKGRQMYVLGQMERYMDTINERIKEAEGEDAQLLTKEMIEEAREFELVYEKPRFQINAPHFVFYVQKLLQQRPYNNGEPFALSDIETGGYRIYTTLDLEYQEIAQEQVQKGVDVQGKQFGAENAAIVALNPKNGEILAMVGSKNYFADPSPEGCTLGVSCKFEPNVNITDTLQSFGSSMKPMVYYQAVMNGIINAGSLLADVPIKIGNYQPKNYEGGFTGINSVRWQLVESRNIPAIYLVNQLGVENFVKEMQKWGYTTFNNPAGYGPSISVGGADVKLIELAQAYGVFASGGDLTRHEVVLKIEDRNGNIIYEYEPQPERVADPRGVYIINDILNGRTGGPGDSWDGRDISGKTGTSESQRETLFATYTPEIVVVGWIGNNDNSSMRPGASGFRTARPWIAEFVRRIGGSIPKTPFTRPEGVISAGTCSAEEGASCQGVAGSDLGIAGIRVPSYVSVQSATVCKDQKDRLARDIDIAVGMAETLSYRIYRMPDSRMQGFLDEWLSAHPEVGVSSLPTQPCDINRSPGGGNEPWAAFTSPSDGQLLESNSLTISFNGFSTNGKVNKAEIFFNGNLLQTVDSLPHSAVYDLGSVSPGTYSVSVKLTDSSGATGTSTISVEKLGTISITSPSSGANIAGGGITNVSYSYSGTQLNQVQLLVNGSNSGSTCNSSDCVWSVPTSPGSYILQIRGQRKGVTIDSGQITVTVI